MVKITVGEVTVEFDGELTLRAIRRLLVDVAAVAQAITPEVEDEEPKTPISLGFTTEIGKPEEPDLSWYFEE